MLETRLFWYGEMGGGGVWFFAFFLLSLLRRAACGRKRGEHGGIHEHTHITQIYWCLFCFFQKFSILSFFFCSGEGGHIVLFFFCLVFSLWAPWLNTCSHRAAPSPHVDLAKLKRKATTGKRKRHLKRHCVVFGYIWIFMIFTRNWYKLWTELTRGRS